jgi:hypothetical protein
MERRWLSLAHNYEFAERLSDSTAPANWDPNSENWVPIGGLLLGVDTTIRKHQPTPKPAFAKCWRREQGVSAFGVTPEVDQSAGPDPVTDLGPLTGCKTPAIPAD